MYKQLLAVVFAILIYKNNETLSDAEIQQGLDYFNALLGPWP